MYHSIEEYELEHNGLRVLYKQDLGAPVAGLMVTYLVGSRNEATGHTGATHLLEHLMFKGSRRFPKKGGLSVIDRLEEKGALMNATTWLDRTNYYEVLPEEHLPFAIRLEADRMRNALITEKDRADEMPAVRSEYAMGENDAYEKLETHLFATAFMAHPYHHNTIGWLSDIEQVSIERLREFYNTYYWPNNAYVSVITRRPRDEVLAHVRTEFGQHRRSPHAIPVPYTAEPPQLGRRFVEVRRAGASQIVGLAFKVPEALHRDTAALLVLAHVLGGGKTSRLYRALVDKKLASEAVVHFTPSKDPTLLRIYVKLARGQEHDAMYERVLVQCKRLVVRGITNDELARTIAQLETELAFARDGHYATLSALNEAIAIGNWHFYFDLLEAVSRVTPDDVQRVASTYLDISRSTLGYYHGTK